MTHRPFQALALFVLVSCGGNVKSNSAYPPRPAGCEVKLFHGKVQGIVYDDIGRVDSICSSEFSREQCIVELKNQTCKLGGDIVYDVPDDPEKPSPDKVRYTGHVAHTRIPGAR